MNVCFELKLAVQVLLQRAVAGQKAAALRRAPWHPGQGRGKAGREGQGRAPLQGERWETRQGAVWKGKKGGNTTRHLCNNTFIFDLLILTLLWFVWIDFLLFTQRLGLAFFSSWSA